MKPSQHNRRSVRLHGYDDTQSGTHFVMICTYQLQDLFGHVSMGHVSNGTMILNAYGIIVQQEWTQTAVSRSDEETLNHLRAYITSNPTNWAKDTLCSQTGDA